MTPNLALSELHVAAWLDGRAALHNLIASVLVVAAVLVVRTVAVRVIARTPWLTPPARLRWRVHVRWIALLLVLLGLVVVWATELRTLALSFVAFAVAMVLATKELILCLTGAVVRASSGSVRVGDRVEVAGARGEVIDLRPFTTTLLELGSSYQRTGRTLIVPNSVFLTATVVNETMADEFVLHAVTIPLEIDRDWDQDRRMLLEIGRQVCEPYLARARHDMDQTARRHGLAPLNVDPAVTVGLPGPGRLELTLRVPTPARERARVEQKILQTYLDRLDRSNGTPRSDLPATPSL